MASTKAEYDQLLKGTHYRAVKLIGVGGMGEIYEAIDPARAEKVAVKVLRPELLDKSDFRDRMRVEGETIALLSHPNIVAGRGYGETAGRLPYVAMERLYGQTLREELRRRGPLPVSEAVAYARQLLAALGAVHDAGLVHRDVKPDNVMVCADGPDGMRVKLLDFGIAKVKLSVNPRVVPLAIPTREGLCVGTPRYVSPEQAAGAGVDPRSDLYAAGLLLYALVAGRGPFDELRGAESLLKAHQELAPPRPSAVAPGRIPAALEAVILRAIAKTPSARFADAASFDRALASAACAPALPALRPSPRPAPPLHAPRPQSGAERDRSPGAAPTEEDAGLTDDPTIEQSHVNLMTTRVVAPRLDRPTLFQVKPTQLLPEYARPRIERAGRARDCAFGTGTVFSAAAFGAVLGALTMWWLQ